MSIPIVKVVGLGSDGEPRAIAVDGFGRIQTDGGGGSLDTNAINLVGVTARLDGVCDRLDTLIEMLSSGMSNGRFQTINNAASRYIVQQNELAEDWIISSPIPYPDATIYVTQIGTQILPMPMSLETADWQPSGSHEITVHFDNGLCKGFVILH